LKELSWQYKKINFNELAFKKLWVDAVITNTTKKKEKKTHD